MRERNRSRRNHLEAKGRFEGVGAAVEAVIASLTSHRGLRSSTLVNRIHRMKLFGSFVEAQGAPHLDAVTPEQVASFIAARRTNGAEATLSERHSRRAAVRLLYKEARRIGVASSDPALDLDLPPRSPISARPLTEAELELGRSYAVRTIDSRPAVCWALAEATGRTGEMPHIRPSDLDRQAGRVRIHGGKTTDPRWGRLTPWGMAQIERRLRRIRPEEGPDPVLMGHGRWDHPDEGRAAATMAIVAVLKAARLSAPGVNPRSIVAWAGAKARAEGASIEAVARVLGVRSMDTAAVVIGFDWRGEGAR